MKKLFLILALTISIETFSQCAGTNSLQMQVQQWFYFQNKFGPGTDSISIARTRGLRSQLIAANPVDSTSLVTITGIPNEVILGIYDHWLKMDTGDYLQLGNNDADRRLPFTNIRAIATACVVQRVAAMDYQKNLDKWAGTKGGKSILRDTTQ